MSFSPPCYFPPPIQVVASYAIIQGDFAMDNDGEAQAEGEKLGRESSTQFLQISSLGGDSCKDEEDEEDEELLRSIMK